MNSTFPKKVLVTGARGGLGRAVVSKFQRSGCEVTGTYFPAHGGEFRDSAVGQWIGVDLTQSLSVQNAFRDLTFDAVIHCAGGFRFSKLDETSDEDFDFLIDTNLRSAFLVARQFLPGMKKQNFGRIVFISSRATFHPATGVGAYVASKAGLNLLTTVLAEEVKPFDITVNAVLPSIIDTPANRKEMPKSDFSAWVTPEQIAEVIYSLVSPWGNPINGSLLPIAGKL